MVLVCGIFLGNLLVAQVPDRKLMREWSASQMPSAMQIFREMLQIPNDAHFPSHVKANVDWMHEAFRTRGFDVRTLETGGPDALLASFDAGAAKTVLIYLQIDGQPVDSSAWFQDSPYEPVIKVLEEDQWQSLPWEQWSSSDETRVFARSASDAKGPVAMFLSAWDIIRSRSIVPNYNIKIIMDFEEELGSPHLPAAVERYKDLLRSDMLIILDGPRHISNQPTLTFGARGITTMTMTVFGPRVAQHSGHYGNYAPNPALKLSRLLSSMKDENGVVTISGYYDGVSIDEETRAILRAVPDDESAIRKSIGVAQIDGIATTYQESIQYPSLNIRGMQSAWIGDQARTIVPPEATAEIDIRLVKESDSDRLVSLIENHISQQGYYITRTDPTEEERMREPNIVKITSSNSYKAFRTSFNSEVGIWLKSALERGFEQTPIRQRTSGGSIPIAPFVSTLGIPAVTVPTVNRDNNQHSPNENIRVGNIRSGILTCLSILTEPL